MKKRNAVSLSGLALAASAVCAPTVAHAQSSVTLYGILDAGITYVNNAGGAHQFKFDDGISYGNRIGFKGVEDLGGGLQAVFVLESGFHLAMANWDSAVLNSDARLTWVSRTAGVLSRSAISSI